LSNDAITWAYKQKGMKPIPKFVLVTLANYANEIGECYPGLNRLVADTGMHKSTLIRNIFLLEEAKLIETIVRGGEGKGRETNIYRLAISPLFGSKVAESDIAETGEKEAENARSQSATLGARSQSATGAMSLSAEARSRSATQTHNEPTIDNDIDSENKQSRRERHCKASKPEIIHSLVQLKYTHHQIYNAKTMARIEAWIEAGVRTEDIETITSMIRQKYPEKDFGPGYLSGPLLDYKKQQQEGKHNGTHQPKNNSSSRSTGTLTAGKASAIATTYLDAKIKAGFA